MAVQTSIFEKSWDICGISVKKAKKNLTNFKLALYYLNNAAG